MKLLINIILFKICWITCVYCAGQGKPFIGPAVVTLSVLFQFLYFKFNTSWLLFLLFVGTLGSLYDSLACSWNIISFPNDPVFYPLWMSALWVNFASLLHFTLSWMQKKYFISIVFGFFGGPISYFTGKKLGAITLLEPTFLSLIVIACMWAIIMPILLKTSEKVRL